MNETRAQKIQANVFKRIDANAISAATAETIWPGAATMKIRLLGWSLSVSAAAALEFQDSADDSVVMQSPLVPTAGVHNSPDMGDGIVLPAGSSLDLDVSANATVSGMVWGREEPA